MRVTKVDGCYICICGYQDRELPKAAGFRWNDPVPKAWATRSVGVAKNLSAYADETCKAELEAAGAQHKASIEMSWSTSSDFIPPSPPGMEYMPFQRAGIEYAVYKNGIALIADEQGLGKTIQAIGCINILKPSSVLVVCPASLKLNWRDECKRWLTEKLNVTVIGAKYNGTRPDGITIINYDILSRFDWLYEPWDMVILDEAHYIKGHSTLRYKCVKKLKAKSRLSLTGTPIPNKPIEIQPVLAWLRPDLPIFNNRMKFALRYCEARHDRFGWKMDGASHREELNNLLRSECMIRRLKKDVLKELPPKIHQVIELPSEGLEEMIAEEWDAYHKHENMLDRLRTALQLAKAAENDHEYHRAVENLKDGQAAAFAEMALMRLRVAKAKTPFVISHIHDSVAPDHPIILFAHHHEVIETIYNATGKHLPVTVTGKVPLAQRHENVKLFQNGLSHLFIGNIQAAGVGLTLTRSSHVVFAELDWVPANLAQASDRAHRIGQQDSVLVQYLVLEGSLDAYMAKRLVAKQRVIDDVLNTRVAVADDSLNEPIVSTEPENSRPATESTSRKKIADIAMKLSQADIQFAHNCLKQLAGLDLDFARIKNNVGFNRIDAAVGHELAARRMLTPRQAALAAKIAAKYSAQLGEEAERKLKEMTR